MNQTMSRSWALFALTMFGTSLGGCTPSTPPTCPSGWTVDYYTTGDCRASDAFVQGVRQRIQVGAYGFARRIEGNCMPGNASTCTAAFVPGLVIDAYPSSAIPAAVPCNFTPSTAATASATIAADGTYSMHLDPGAYSLVATDPISHCAVANPVQIPSGDVVASIFVFDHGGTESQWG